MIAIGRTVIVKGLDKSINNGTDTAPATVVRVWTDHMVNVKVHLDGKEDLWATSINLFDTPSEAMGHVNTTGQLAAHWPERS